MGCEVLGSELRALVDRPLPDAVRVAAERTLLNVVAAAIGASNHEVVEKIVRLAERHGGAPVAPIAGRSIRSDAYYSALANGTAARVLDFDDAHLDTLTNPAAATFAATVALAATHPCTGAGFLSAFALGCELTIRLAVAISPRHFEIGWDSSSTCGVIGAAAASALLLGADGDAVTNAIGIAVSETLGQREAFGTASGAMHAGKAGSNGMLAALLAVQGFTGMQTLNHPDGFFKSFPVVEPHTAGDIVAGLGEKWLLLENTFKPYPAAILASPAIEAVLALRDKFSGADEIEEIRVRSSPRLGAFAGLVDPRETLDATLSAPHAVALAFCDGKFGPDQLGPERFAESDVLRMREAVLFLYDPNCAADAAIVEIERKDGSVERLQIEHARGSLARPLTEDELLEKARVLIEPVKPGGTDRLHAAVLGLVRAPAPHAFIAEVAS